MKRFIVIIFSILNLLSSVYAEDQCSSVPPYKKEVKQVLDIFGYSGSCISSALNWCDHSCQQDFPTAIKESENSILQAATALQSALDKLQSLSSCLKKERFVEERDAKVIVQETTLKPQGESKIMSDQDVQEENTQEKVELIKEHGKVESQQEKIELEQEVEPEEQSEQEVEQQPQEHAESEEIIPIASTLPAETKVNARVIPTNCQDVHISGSQNSGISTIYPYFCCPDKQLSVYCEHESKDGGWTVIQRREPLPVRENFYRGWTEYANGFGNLAGEFWLGLDNIHELTSQSQTTLRIEMENKEGERRYAEYDDFKVGNASSKYELVSVGSYSGNAGDALSVHSSHQFSTKDSDNDSHSESNCAVSYKGAWWYGACHTSNLNGHQYVGETESYGDGIVWKQWLGFHYSLPRVVMMIRSTF